jgi:hypothetical protein
MVSWAFTWGFGAGCAVCILLHWISERIVKMALQRIERRKWLIK